MRDSRSAVVPVVSVLGAACGMAACIALDRLLASAYGTEIWAGSLLADGISVATCGCFGATLALLLERCIFIFRQGRVPEVAALGVADDALLTPDDVKAARQQFAALAPAKRRGLQARLLEAGLQRARAHWSAEDVSDAVKTEAELVQTRTYAEYSMIRFLVWAIPTLGFIGTVVGISQAMGMLSGSPLAAVATADADPKDPTRAVDVLPDAGDSPKGGDPKGGDPKGGDPKGGDPKGGDPKGAGQQGGDPKGDDPKGGGQQGGDPKGGGQQGDDPQSGGQQGGDPKGGGQQGDDPQSGGQQGDDPKGGGQQGDDPKGGGQQGGDPKGGGQQAGDPAQRGSSRPAGSRVITDLPGQKPPSGNRPPARYAGPDLKDSLGAGANRESPQRQDAEMATAQRALAMAFNTTFVALVLSLVAMFVLHRVESWEDGLLVDATRSVLRRLPLRMYIRQERLP